MHTLYIVGTPIGNLEDITYRAVRVLGEVGLIVAEDTRVTKKLLQRYGIRTPLNSYHQHSPPARTAAILKALREKDVALVSDAGMPAINDPGADLVAAAVEAGATVVAAPGPSALTTAIAVSGLPVEQLVYVGFLPNRAADRRRLLEAVADERRMLVAFEAPHRLRASLADILAALGDRRLAVCRELTKLHEEVYRGRVSGGIAHFAAPRGELTLVIEGAPETRSEPAPARAAALDSAASLLAERRAQGARSRDAVAEVAAATGLPKNEVYRLWVGMGRGG